MSEFAQFKKKIRERANTLKDAIAEVEELRLVEKSRTARWREHLGHAEEALQGQLLRVAVVGSVKSGKSTLINALIGEDLLRRGAGVITAFITRLRTNGERGGWLEFKPWPRVLEEVNASVRMLPMAGDAAEEPTPLDIREDGQRERLGKLLEGVRTEWQQQAMGQLDPNFMVLSAYLEGYVRMRDHIGESVTRLPLEPNALLEHRQYVGEESRAVYLKDVEICHPVPWLGENVEIADCQGSDAPNPMHYDLLQQYILKSHFIVYTISSRTGLREADFKLLDFIKSLRMLPQTFFVLNADLDAHPNAESLSELEERVRTELGWIVPSPRLHVFSALHHLFESMGESAGERDRSRLALWRGDAALARQTEKGYAAFREQLAQRVSAQKTRVLLGSGLSRLTMIAGAVRDNVQAQKQILERGDIDRRGVEEELKSKQKALNATIATMENSITGLKDALKSEMDDECRAYFDPVQGPIVEETLATATRHPVDVKHRRAFRDPRHLPEKLHFFYMELRRSLSRHIVERVNTQLIAFAKELEDALEERFTESSSAFWALFNAALDDYHRELARFGVDAPPRERMAPFPEPSSEGLAPPSFAGFMEEEALGRGVLLVKFGLGTLTSLLVGVKNRLGKRERQLADERGGGMAQEAVHLVKNEVAAELLHAFRTYGQSFRTEYLHKLVDAKARRLMEGFMLRAEMAQLDFSNVMRRSEMEGVNRRRLLEDLDRVLRTTGPMAEELDSFRCAVNLEWLSGETEE